MENYSSKVININGVELQVRNGSFTNEEVEERIKNVIAAQEEAAKYKNIDPKEFELVIKL